MTPTDANTCKGCGKPIVWRRLNGRWHPCDPARLTIVADDPSGGRLVSGHESHFATCPNAGKFRRPRATRGPNGTDEKDKQRA